MEAIHGDKLRGHLETLILAALAGLALPTRACAQLQVDIRAGFADTLVPGRWSPLELTLYNTGSARRGEAFLRVPATESAPAFEYVERIEIPHQGRRTAQFALPLTPGTNGLVVGMRDEAGRTFDPRLVRVLDRTLRMMRDREPAQVSA